MKKLFLFVIFEMITVSFSIGNAQSQKTLDSLMLIVETNYAKGKNLQLESDSLMYQSKVSYKEALNLLETDCDNCIQQSREKFEEAKAFVRKSNEKLEESDSYFREGYASLRLIDYILHNN